MEEAAAAVSSEKAAESASYTYWVREVSHDAAPLPTPKKIEPADPCNQSNQTHLGSAWNRAGTWEEKNMNAWASDRIKELLASTGPLEFSGGWAQIAKVTKCIGDAFVVTVRNKKRVGYTYELTLEVKGEWHVGGERKKVKGHIDILEFSFGELDDLQVEVKLSEAKDFQPEEKHQISQDLRSVLKPVREKLLKFEEELRAQ